MFARYSLIGALSGAFGALAAATPDYLAVVGISQLPPSRRCSSSMRCSAWPAACSMRASRSAFSRSQGQATAALGTVATYRLPAGRLVQPRCLRRRLRRAVAAGAVAVRAFRPVAVGGEPVLLLGRRALGLLVPGGGLAVAAHRPRQHDGVHAYPVELLPDPARPSRRRSPSRSRCCWCARRSRRWTCRRAHPT